MLEKNEHLIEGESTGKKSVLGNETTEYTQQELTENLEKGRTTPEEYFKDLEKTGKYPKEIQEVLESGEFRNIIKTLKAQGVEIISSKEKILGFLPNDKLNEIRDLSHKHFGTECFLVDYSGEGRKECSDGSDLLVPVKLDGKTYLAKLACGEFNRKTFTEGSKRLPDLSLHKSEIPLFVVNQSDSYFATAGTHQANIRNIDVRLYLDLYATIASLKSGEAVKRWLHDENLEFFDWSQIKIPEYEELKSILEGKIQEKQ